MELNKKVKEYVLTRNIRQCNKFISDYVKKDKDI